MITLHQDTDYIAYWVLFWSIVNLALPPREFFANAQGVTPNWYNKLLMLIAYYGSLNLRPLTVKLYDAVNQAPKDVVAQVTTETTVQPMKEGAPATHSTTTTPVVVPPTDSDK